MSSSLLLRLQKGSPLTWQEHDDIHQGLSNGSMMDTVFALPGAITTVGDATIGGNVSAANLSGTNTGDQDIQAALGALSFLDLGDTPASYSGQAGKTLAVTGTEDGVEFITPTPPTLYQWLYFKASDETLTITAGTAKVSWYNPANFTVTEVVGFLGTASSSGDVVFDINEAGVSILGNKITVEANENKSTDATTQPTITDSSIAAGALMTIDFDSVGTGAKNWMIGLKVAIV